MPENFLFDGTHFSYDIDHIFTWADQPKKGVEKIRIHKSTRDSLAQLTIEIEELITKILDPKQFIALRISTGFSGGKGYAKIDIIGDMCGGVKRLLTLPDCTLIYTLASDALSFGSTHMAELNSVGKEMIEHFEEKKVKHVHDPVIVYNAHDGDLCLAWSACFEKEDEK
jgi:hypothetical protein